MTAAFMMRHLFAGGLLAAPSAGPASSSESSVVHRQPPPGVRVSVGGSGGGSVSAEDVEHAWDHLKVPVVVEGGGDKSPAAVGMAAEEEADFMRRVLAKQAAEATSARVRGSVWGATTPKAELPVGGQPGDTRNGALAWLDKLWHGEAGPSPPPVVDTAGSKPAATPTPPPATPPPHAYATPTPVAQPAMGEDAAGALLSRRAAYTAPGREWRRMRRAVEDANPVEDPDVQLLFDGEPADGTDGVNLIPPTVAVVPSDEDVAGPRADHEAAALLAIVVPTAPRVVAGGGTLLPR